MPAEFLEIFNTLLNGGQFGALAFGLFKVGRWTGDMKRWQMAQDARLARLESAKP